MGYTKKELERAADELRQNELNAARQEGLNEGYWEGHKDGIKPLHKYYFWGALLVGVLIGLMLSFVSV